MALIIDATVSGASANSYVTLAEAIAYFEGRLFADAWTSASVADQNAALVWAASIIDTRVRWKGTLPTYTQSRAWPRAQVDDPIANDGRWIDSTIVPKAIKDAQCEMSMSLLTADRTADPDLAGYTNIQVGSLSIGVDKSTVAKTLPTGVIEMLSPYGQIAGTGFSYAQVERT